MLVNDNELKVNKFSGNIGLHVITYKNPKGSAGFCMMPATNGLECISRAKEIVSKHNLKGVTKIETTGKIHPNHLPDKFTMLYKTPNKNSEPMMAYVVGTHIEDYAKLSNRQKPSAEYVDKCREYLEAEEAYELCANIRDNIKHFENGKEQRNISGQSAANV